MAKAKKYTSMLHTRIDIELKEEGEQVLQSLGMTTTEAIRQFFKYVVKNKSLLFLHDGTSQVSDTGSKPQSTIFSSYG